MDKVFQKEAAKKTLVALGAVIAFSAAALVFVIAFYMTVWFISDNSDLDVLTDRTGWQKILNSAYGQLQIRESDNTLFMGQYLDHTITMYSPDNGEITTMQAPVDNFLGLYVGDLLWLRQYATMELISYNFETETWNSHPETEAFGEDIRCSITQDGNLLVHGRDFLWEYVDQVWSPNYWTLDEELRSVFQDDEGVIWAKTANNNLYAFTQDHHCEYVGQMRINGDPVRINDSEFWLLGMERVYLWDPSTPEKSPEFLREFSDESHLRLIKIQSDTYYLATSKNIWKYQNGEWEKAKIPILIKSIHNVVFDEVLQRMYIATDRGVYYKDLPL